MSAVTFAALINQRIIVHTPNSKYFAVEKSYLTELLKPYISLISVDSGWYLSKYEDVRSAVDEGIVESAQEHYRTSGFFEHRMPYSLDVEEEWYLSQYPDVKTAVDEGRFASGREHFEIIGYAEGRHPRANFRLNLMQV